MIRMKNMQSELKTLVAFRKLVQRNESRVERILTLESYEHDTLGDFPKHLLDLPSMTESAKEFSFEADCVYEVTR